MGVKHFESYSWTLHRNILRLEMQAYKKLILLINGPKMIFIMKLYYIYDRHKRACIDVYSIGNCTKLLKCVCTIISIVLSNEFTLNNRSIFFALKFSILIFQIIIFIFRNSVAIFIYLLVCKCLLVEMHIMVDATAK